MCWNNWRCSDKGLIAFLATTTRSKAAAATDGASKKGKIAKQPAKRKATKAAEKETAPARKRVRATKGQVSGKKKDDDEKKVKDDEDVEDAGNANGDKSYWLMKAEPNTRLEKGVDVKFSIDDLREAAEPEPWDGAFLPSR